MDEIWKDIQGYEGHYAISTCGHVKSLDRTIHRRMDTNIHNYGGSSSYVKGCEIRSYISRRGYESVVLCKDGVQKHYRVHRLVAIAFIPNPFGYKEVNHIDENKLNNNVENLEWCTRRYNMNYGSVSEKLRRFQKDNSPKAKKVAQYDLSMNLIDTYDSLRKAQDATGIPYQSIGQCCLGRYSHSGGYIWKFL